MVLLLLLRICCCCCGYLLTISIGRERMGRHGHGLCLWSMVYGSASLWLWLWLRREQQAPVVAGQTKSTKYIYPTRLSVVTLLHCQLGHMPPAPLASNNDIDGQTNLIKCIPFVCSSRVCFTENSGSWNPTTPTRARFEFIRCYYADISISHR